MAVHALPLKGALHTQVLWRQQLSAPRGGYFPKFLKRAPNADWTPSASANAVVRRLPLVTLFTFPQKVIARTAVLCRHEPPTAKSGRFLKPLDWVT
jgi:hypothetical protein